MVDAVADLTGSQRAAIFLLGVGEEGAAAIMRHMEPKEVQRVGEAMAQLSDVSDDQINAVVQEFSDKVSQVSPISIGAGDFTKRVMVQALGENRARTMINRVMQSGSSKGLDALKWMDARAVTRLIKNEHPQIVAIVLTSLDEDHAAQVLAMLPEEVRTDVVLRIAKLDMIDPAALQELDQVLEKQLGNIQDIPPTSVDGMSSAAAILNNLDSEQEAALLESMKSVDSDLGERIQEKMFVFDNLNAVDDRGMQRLIREIAVDSLVIALKGVDPQLQNKFFKNMSSRAADMLREDLESKGPVKLSEVEAAQKEILTIATRLSEEGEIMLGKDGGDFV